MGGDELLKVQVAKMQYIMSRSGICNDRDGGGEGPECMVEGKGEGMGPPMNKDRVEVKDDIIGGMEGSEDGLGDGRCSLNDKAGVTCEGEESKSDMVGEGVAKHVHGD